MRYVITFFARDEKGQRKYMFPEEWYYVTNSAGQITGYEDGYRPETVYAMMQWFDENPLSKMISSYNIGWAFTDLAPSSIIIEAKSDDPDFVDEMIMSLKMFAGRDVRFRKPEELSPRRRPSENITSSGPDRYAR